MKPLGRAVAGLFSVIYLATNVVFSHAAEAGFWEERRRSARATSSSITASGAALVSVPAQAVLSSLPSVERVTASLPPSVARGLPAAAGRLAPLLTALPARLGTVRKISFPGDPRRPGPVVLHIQDVHQNADAQRNIGELVGVLARAHLTDVVALEGSWRPLDFSSYRNFPYPGAVRRAADYLLKENRITGPIHAAVTGDGSFPRLVGVDDEGLHASNVDAYLRAAPLAEAAKRRLAQDREKLDRRKAAVFNASLKTLDEKVEAYRSGRLSLGDYARALEASVSPSVSHFLKVVDLESSLDFARVESERRRLVEALARGVSPAQLDSLAQEAAAHKAGALRAGDFYRFLQTFCSNAGVDLAVYPAMAAYVRYVLAADGIDAEELFRALQSLEKASYARLSRTPEEKKLVSDSRRMSLREKMVAFSLSPEEWREYEEGEHGDLPPFEDFYRHAHSRDAALAGNLLSALGDRKTPMAVLVTGGHHAPGIAERLTREGCTVVSFIPRIEKVSPAENALTVFAQEKTPLARLFEGQRLYLGRDPAEGASVLPVLTLAGSAWVAGVNIDLTSLMRLVLPRVDGHMEADHVRRGNVISLRVHVVFKEKDGKVRARSVTTDVELNPSGVVVKVDEHAVARIENRLGPAAEDMARLVGMAPVSPEMQWLLLKNLPFEEGSFFSWFVGLHKNGSPEDVVKRVAGLLLVAEAQRRAAPFLTPEGVLAEIARHAHVAAHRLYNAVSGAPLSLDFGSGRPPELVPAGEGRQEFLRNMASLLDEEFPGPWSSERSFEERERIQDDLDRDFSAMTGVEFPGDFLPRIMADPSLLIPAFLDFLETRGKSLEKGGSGLEPAGDFLELSGEAFDFPEAVDEDWDDPDLIAEAEEIGLRRREDRGIFVKIQETFFDIGSQDTIRLGTWLSKASPRQVDRVRDRILAADKKIARLSQWDFLHRYPGAYGLKAVSLDLSLAPDGDGGETLAVAMPFSFHHRYSDNERHSLVLEIPLPSICRLAPVTGGGDDVFARGEVRVVHDFREKQRAPSAEEAEKLLLDFQRALPLLVRQAEKALAREESDGISTRPYIFSDPMVLWTCTDLSDPIRNELREAEFGLRPVKKGPLVKRLNAIKRLASLVGSWPSGVPLPVRTATVLDRERTTLDWRAVLRKGGAPLALPGTYGPGKWILLGLGMKNPTDRDVELYVAWWFEFFNTFSPLFVFRHWNAAGQLVPRLFGHAAILTATMLPFLLPGAESVPLLTRAAEAVLANMGVHGVYNLFFPEAPLTSTPMGRSSSDGAFDPRPVRAGLLSEKTARQAESLRRAISPSLPLTAVSMASDTDLAFFFLSIAPLEAAVLGDFKGVTPVAFRAALADPEAYIKKELHPDYKQLKYLEGVTAFHVATTPPRIIAALLVELTALGVPLEKVEADSTDGLLRLRFPWAPLGGTEKSRTVCFFNDELARSTGAPPALKAFFGRGVDVYSVRLESRVRYPLPMMLVDSVLAENGFLITQGAVPEVSDAGYEEVELPGADSLDLKLRRRVPSPLDQSSGKNLDVLAGDIRKLDEEFGSHWSPRFTRDWSERLLFEAALRFTEAAEGKSVSLPNFPKPSDPGGFLFYPVPFDPLWAPEPFLRRLLFTSFPTRLAFALFLRDKSWDPNTNGFLRFLAGHRERMFFQDLCAGLQALERKTDGDLQVFEEFFLDLTEKLRRLTQWDFLHRYYNSSYLWLSIGTDDEVFREKGFKKIKGQQYFHLQPREESLGKAMARVKVPYESVFLTRFVAGDVPWDVAVRGEVEVVDVSPPGKGLLSKKGVQRLNRLLAYGLQESLDILTELSVSGDDEQAERKLMDFVQGMPSPLVKTTLADILRPFHNLKTAFRDPGFAETLQDRYSLIMRTIAVVRSLPPDQRPPLILLGKDVGVDWRKLASDASGTADTESPRRPHDISFAGEAFVEKFLWPLLSDPFVMKEIAKAQTRVLSIFLRFHSYGRYRLFRLLEVDLRALSYPFLNVLMDAAGFGPKKTASPHQKMMDRLVPILQREIGFHQKVIVETRRPLRALKGLDTGYFIWRDVTHDTLHPHEDALRPEGGKMTSVRKALIVLLHEHAASMKWSHDDIVGLLRLTLDSPWAKTAPLREILLQTKMTLSGTPASAADRAFIERTGIAARNLDHGVPKEYDPFHLLPSSIGFPINYIVGLQLPLADQVASLKPEVDGVTAKIQSLTKFISASKAQKATVSGAWEAVSIIEEVPSMLEALYPKLLSLADKILERKQEYVGMEGSMVKFAADVHLIPYLIEAFRQAHGFALNKLPDEPFDLAELLDKAVAGRENVRLEKEKKFVPTRGSAFHSAIALRNLLNNADKYAKDRAARTGLSPRIDVRLSREGKFVRVDVADNGPGIPAEVLAKLFVLNGSTKKGGGLGLIQAKMVFEKAGGSLSIDTLTEQEGDAFLSLDSTLRRIPYQEECRRAAAHLLPAIEGVFHLIFTTAEGAVNGQDVSAGLARAAGAIHQLSAAGRDVSGWPRFLYAPETLFAALSAAKRFEPGKMSEQEKDQFRRIAQNAREAKKMFRRFALGGRMEPGTTFTILLPIKGFPAKKIDISFVGTRGVVDKVLWPMMIFAKLHGQVGRAVQSLLRTGQHDLPARLENDPKSLSFELFDELMTLDNFGKWFSTPSRFEPVKRVVSDRLKRAGIEMQVVIINRAPPPQAIPDLDLGSFIWRDAERGILYIHEEALRLRESWVETFLLTVILHEHAAGLGWEHDEIVRLLRLSDRHPFVLASSSDQILSHVLSTLEELKEPASRRDGLRRFRRLQYRFQDGWPAAGDPLDVGGRFLSFLMGRPLPLAPFYLKDVEQWHSKGLLPPSFNAKNALDKVVKNGHLRRQKDGSHHILIDKALPVLEGALARAALDDFLQGNEAAGELLAEFSEAAVPLVKSAGRREGADMKRVGEAAAWAGMDWVEPKESPAEEASTPVRLPPSAVAKDDPRLDAFRESLVSLSSVESGLSPVERLLLRVAGDRERNAAITVVEAAALERGGALGAVGPQMLPKDRPHVAAISAGFLARAVAHGRNDDVYHLTHKGFGRISSAIKKQRGVTVLSLLAGWPGLVLGAPAWLVLAIFRTLKPLFVAAGHFLSAKVLKRSSPAVPSSGEVFIPRPFSFQVALSLNAVPHVEGERVLLDETIANTRAFVKRQKPGPSTENALLITGLLRDAFLGDLSAPGLAVEGLGALWAEGVTLHAKAGNMAPDGRLHDIQLLLRVVALGRGVTPDFLPVKDLNDLFHRYLDPPVAQAAWSAILDNVAGADSQGTTLWMHNVTSLLAAKDPSRLSGKDRLSLEILRQQVLRGSQGDSRWSQAVVLVADSARSGQDTLEQLLQKYPELAPLRRSSVFFSSADHAGLKGEGGLLRAFPVVNALKKDGRNIRAVRIISPTAMDIQGLEGLLLPDLLSLALRWKEVLDAHRWVLISA
jgi:signal transduction histidine kinase